MIGSLVSLACLAAVPVTEAFPRWQRQARQIDAQAAASLLVCPAPVTSFVPIITTIPECTQGNACKTNTIISQGQTYITSTLASAAVTGLPGDIVGGTTVVNAGASATNVDYSSFSVCTGDCTIAGNTFTPGTVYYSSSSLLQPSQTAVIGGASITGAATQLTSASAVTQTFYSTTVNGVSVTGGSQPLTTITTGNDGIATTVIEPASQVVSSLQNAATPGVGSGVPVTNVITMIVPAAPVPTSITLTQVVFTGSDGNPTTSPVGAENPAPVFTSPSINDNGSGNVPSAGTTVIVGGPSGGSNTDTSPTLVPSLPQATTTISPGGSGNPGNNAGGGLSQDPSLSTAIVGTPIQSSVGIPTITSSAAASVTVPPSITSSSAGSSATSVPCLNDQDCSSLTAGICLKADGALATEAGICVASIISTSVTIPQVTQSASSALASTTSGTAPVTLPVSTCTTGTDCFLGVCLDVGLTPLVGTGLGVCLGSNSNTPTGTSSSAPGQPTASGAPTSGAVCQQDTDCLIGLCLNAQLAPVLGLGTGLCLGNDLGLGSGIPSTSATVSVSAGLPTSTTTASAICNANKACAVGVCLGANLQPIIGLGTGICLGSNTGTAVSSAATSSPSTGAEVSPEFVSCGTSQDCLVGICLNLGILGGKVCVGGTSPSTGASVSVGSPTQPTLLPGLTSSAPGSSPTPPGAITCTTASGCLVGICSQIGLLGLGANVGICVASTSEVVSASVSITAPATPSSTAALPSIPVGATSCGANKACTVGICGQVGLFDLGTDIGVCVDAGTGAIITVSASVSVGSPAQSTLALPSQTMPFPGSTASPSVTPCTLTTPCLAGVCAQIGLLGLGADVGVCVSEGSDPLLSASIGGTILPPGSSSTPAPVLPIVTIPNPSATIPGAPASTTAQTCTEATQCADPLLGLCVDASVLNIGAGVSICAGATLSPTSAAVDANGGASVSVPIIVAPAPTSTLATSFVAPLPSAVPGTISPTGQIYCDSPADCPEFIGKVGLCVNVAGIAANLKVCL